MDKLEFTLDSKKYFTVKPSPRQEKDGMIVFAKTLTKLVKEGIMSQDRLEKYLKEQGVWDDEKQAKREEIEKILVEGKQKLDEGGIPKWEARKIAIEMRIKRYELMALIMERTRLEGFTAEAIADTERTDFFISCCTKNEDGTKVFPTIDDYQNQADTNLGAFSATNFAKLYNGYGEDTIKKLPENVFLFKYGYVNDNLELVNQEGKYVDVEGNVIEEPKKVEFKEFLD